MLDILKNGMKDIFGEISHMFRLFNKEEIVQQRERRLLKEWENDLEGEVSIEIKFSFLNISKLAYIAMYASLDCIGLFHL